MHHSRFLLRLCEDPCNIPNLRQLDSNEQSYHHHDTHPFLAHTSFSFVSEGIMPEHHLLDTNKDMAHKSRQLLFTRHSLINNTVCTWLNTAQPTLELPIVLIKSWTQLAQESKQTTTEGREESVSNYWKWGKEVRTFGSILTSLSGLLKLTHWNVLRTRTLVSNHPFQLCMS